MRAGTRRVYMITKERYTSIRRAFRYLHIYRTTGDGPMTTNISASGVYRRLRSERDACAAPTQTGREGPTPTAARSDPSVEPPPRALDYADTSRASGNELPETPRSRRSKGLSGRRRRRSSNSEPEQPEFALRTPKRRRVSQGAQRRRAELSRAAELDSIGLGWSGDEHRRVTVCVSSDRGW